ncbi:MAG: elongation factor G [Dehalococcoidales bacterium]|nr:elongation factor G [Dehalococcoidales bacterium]
MKQYQPENIRNVVLLSHSGAGKTTLSEAMLFNAGVINRLGKVDAGTTTSDYDQDEIKRKISINTTLLPYEWHDAKVNLLDTPGYSDFAGEVDSAVRVCEGAVIVAAASSGLEVGTEQAWSYCDKAKLARLFFINKMDRENADFGKITGEIQAKFGAKCIPVQMPVGAHTDFRGVVSLLTMKYYAGEKGEEADVPSEIKEQATSLREKMVEAIAETDDNLMEKYLNGEELSQEELLSTLKKAIADVNIFPILAGSALQNVAVNRLMDVIREYLPSPKDAGINVSEDSAGKDIKISTVGPLSALVFKTSADPYVGKLTYFKVFSGELESNSQVWNVNQNNPERIGQLFIIRGKNQEPIAKISAGDMGAVAKLSITATGDTLGAQDKPVKIAPATYPKTLFSVAVLPKTKADVDKLGSSLARLAEEDPTLIVHRDPDTGETILSGLGETQVEVAAEKMMRKFGVAVELKAPKVPYKETITSAAKGEYKHKKQTGGHGQYGHVILELEPMPEGGDNQFENRVVGGTIPRNYIPAVEKGVHEAIKEGVLAGYPIVNIRTLVMDGSFHPVDSSEICFKIAGAGAFKKAMADGHPILLEPIVNLKIRIPGDYTGDIIGDLNTKRARVQGMNPEGNYNVVDAQVPLAEILRYAIDLKSMTQGRGSFSYEFDHYEEVPAHITQKIVAEHEAEKQKMAEGKA